jgi:hypothetical protein
MTAGSTFLQRMIVKEHGWGEDLDLLIAPVVWAIVVSAVAFIAAGRLRLQGASADDGSNGACGSYCRACAVCPTSRSGRPIAGGGGAEDLSRPAT